MARAPTRSASLALAVCAAAVSVGWNDATPPSRAPIAPVASLVAAPRGHPHVYKSLTERAREARERGAVPASGPPAGPRPFDVPGRLDYYGGRVISNVEIVPVFWTSAVESTVQTQIQGFLSAVTASPYLDWLQEYDTIGLTGQADGMPGSNQHIGRGIAVTPVTISPMNTSTTLADMDIQTELAAQLYAGSLPAPKKDGAGNVNTLYMIEFPDTYTINLEGHLNCSYFCGYHFTLRWETLSVPYAVMPGIAGCGSSCGSGFDWVTSIHSHELAESITDTEVGFTQTQPTEARPLGWYDPGDNMEIADICDPFAAAPGVTGGTTTIAGFTVQLLWSNFAGACVGEIPICDGSTSPPACRPCTPYDDGVGCNGMTPVCQTSTTAPDAGQCVGCVDDKNCADPAPICDATTYVCRACTAADCTGSTAVCGPSGACVQCDATNQSACAGKTAVCDTVSGSCVGCLSNLDCTADTPVCDPMTQACRGCETNADCTDGLVCDASNDGQKGQCVPCNGDLDCTFGKCDAKTHTCAALPSAPRDGGVGGGPPGDNPQGVSGGSSGCACRAAPNASDDLAPLSPLAAAGLAFAFRRRRSARERN